MGLKSKAVKVACCSHWKYYKGKRKPRCSGGKGCRACWRTYRFKRSWPKDLAEPMPLDSHPQAAERLRRQAIDAVNVEYWEQVERRARRPEVRKALLIFADAMKKMEKEIGRKNRI